MKKLMTLFLACIFALPLLYAQVPGPNLNESFENGVIPDNWTVLNVDGGTQEWNTTTVNPRTGTHAVRVRWESSTLDNDDWLITPPLWVTASTNDEISFWLRTHNATNADPWEVLISTTTTNPSSFTVIDSGPGMLGEYVQKTYSLDTYGDAIVYLAIRYIGSYDWYLYVDDFVGPPVAIPTCPAPTDLTATNLTTSSADLGWTPGGTETLWHLKYGEPGFDLLTEGTLIPNVTSNPYTLGGLPPVTPYEFYVQAECGENDLSTWAGPLLFQTTGDPLSGSYTINSTQPTGGTNFNSFTEFADAINLGGFAGPVVVDVVAGTGPYSEQVIFGELPNSSALNSLTINGNGETLEYLATITDQRATLRLDGTDYVAVDNLIIKALGSVTGEFGWAVHLTNEADYNTFTNCHFIADLTATLTNFAGFVASGSNTGATTAGIAASNLTVENCVSIGGYYGMIINGPTIASGVTPAMNNVVVNNEIKDFRLYGLYVRGQNNAIISGNEISRPERPEVSTAYFIYLAQDMTGTEVTKNRMFDFAGSATTTAGTYGIYATGVNATPGQELLIANNLIYGFEGTNGIQRGMYLLTTDNTRVYHNTISLDNVDHTGASIIYGIHHSGNLTTIDIRNNIISVTSNSTGAKYCLYFGQTAANLPNLTSDHNVLHMGAVDGTNNMVYWGGTGYATLADWQAVQNSDLNSVDVDPLFVNPMGGDMSPQSLVVDNIGTDLLAFVPDDFFGVARTATPDPGAIEFVPPVPGILSGSVTEATRGPIEGAHVYTSFGGYEAYTDEFGNYQIDILSGTYTVYCEADGYFTSMAENVEIIAESTTILNFELDFAQIAVNPLSFEETLMPDATVTKTLNISNPAGTAPLAWSAGVSYLSDLRQTIFSYPEEQGQGIAAGETDADQNPQAFELEPARAMFDLLGHFPMGDATGEYGVATDGNFIYTTKWNAPGNFFKYEMNGTFIGSFTIPGASSVRDLTYDGQYFYGSPASTTIYQMDFTNQTLVATIIAPAAVRGIAYDADNDGFWVTNGWNPPIRLISRTGAVLETLNTASSSFSGIAWENITDGSPYLWGYTQPASNNILVQIDITTGATLQTFDVATTGIIGFEAISGGLVITDQVVPGHWAFLGASQNDVIWMLELAPAASWLALDPPSGTVLPGESVNVDVTFDAFELEEGLYQAEIRINHNGQPNEMIAVPVALNVSLVGCPMPVDLMATNITEVSALLGWTAGGDENEWNLIWGLEGFDPQSQGTLVEGLAAASYELTGLTESTIYEFYVQAICGEGVVSDWAGPAAFETLGDALSGAYTINSTLPTSGRNFNSFNDFALAINTYGLAGPVVVDVVAGTGPYNEQIVFGELLNSSDVNTLTINGNGEVLEFLSTDTNARGTLKLDGTDYVTVDNLVIKALGSVTGEFGWAVHLANEADYSTFTNCYFIADMSATLTGFAAFVTSNSNTGATTAGLAASNLTIENCVSSGGYYGIIVNGPTTASGATPAMNNVIINNEIKDFRLYGLYLRGQNNAIISDNEISRPEREEVSTTYMLYMTQNMTGTQVTNNRLFEFAGNTTSTSAAYGIYGTTITATPGEELLIANNLIYGFDGMNGITRGMYLLTTSNTRVYHNTISVDNIAHTGTSLIIGLHHTGTAAVIDIKNNIISVTANSTGLKHCLFFGTATAVVTTDHNVLHMGSTVGENNHIGRWDGVDYTTLADWQAANNGIYDPNSVAADPLFINPLVGDMTPQNPEANNIGTDLLAYVPFDFFGVARTATPDPGAIEFDPPDCLPPSGLNATNITTNSADLGWVPTGDETMWNLEWGLAGFEQGTGTLIESVISIPYALEGLDHTTSYSFYVQAVCTDNTSGWAGPSNFTTACAEFNLPFVEEFDGASVTCWELEGNWGIGTLFTPPSSVSGVPNAFFNWSPSQTNYSMSLTSPVFNATNIAEVAIDFILFANSYSANTIEKVAVEYKTIDANEWTLLELFTTEGLGTGNEEFIRTEEILTGMGGNVFQIRFRAHGENSFNINGWGLDDIHVYESGFVLLPGDANGDGVIDVNDVIAIAQYILDMNPEPFVFENADVNGDGVVNVSDLIATVNIILGTDLKSLFHGLNSATAHIYLNSKGVSFMSDGTLSGLQFEIEGVDASQLEFLLPGFELLTNMRGDKLIGLIFSLNNTPIPAGKVELFNINGHVNKLKWGEVAAANLVASEVKVQKHIGTLTDAFALSTYPNPTSGQIYAEINIPQESLAVIRVVDMMGREVHKLYDGNLAEGNHTFSADLSNLLRQGIYFLQLEAMPANDSKVISKQLKLVVIN